MIWIHISWGKCGNSVGIAAIKNVILNVLEETSNQLADLQDLCNIEACSIISLFNQTNVDSVCGASCQLG